MKYSVLSCFLIPTILFFSSSSCVEVQRQPNSLDQYKEVYLFTEDAEQILIKYIAKRTVRVIIRCTVYDIDTKKVTKKKYNSGWGTGAIIYSSNNYSLIQTAQHVVVNKDISNGTLIRKHTGFKFERRDINNKIIDSVETKTKIIAVSKKFDIAVIKVYHNYNIQSKFAKYIYLGQSIRVVGFPSNRFVKGKHLSYEKSYIATHNMGVSLVRFGTAGYFGNSGGAVWNQQGEIVGTIISLGGFRTIYGKYVPQQNHLYGPGIKTLRKFYISKKMNYLLNR
ncbi:MAG: trypsin-like peptidase domain-containing protein [Candidatus Peribacteraceae bacterium]|nr:trypsin-like peptidase domain-containing protein [Candidatus Peribacteraceae bacterium]